MSAPEKDGENRLRGWLRDRIDGPVVAPKPEPEPLVKVRYVPPPTAPAPAEPDDQEPEDDEPEEETKRPWWSLPPGPFGHQTPAPEPEPAAAEQQVGPGLYVTVNAPQAAPPPPWLAPDPAAERAAERLHRLRVWFVYHLAAAAAGWAFGLVGLMHDVLVDAGRQGAGVGIAMGFVAWIVASYLPGLPYMPPALRPALVWAARIPVSSAALALALYGPGTV
ncbi:hypothetical protein AB0M75_06485 [Streptomyces anulatus]|uniref:hypothetical protein n=1 Tax=Streptomyces anulatus TaxID=1892 RepID=UPI0034163D79